jgi:hypothetical protein
MPAGIFDAVMAAGRAAVLSGTHTVEASPRPGGHWGLSAVLLAGPGRSPGGPHDAVARTEAVADAA